VKIQTDMNGKIVNDYLTKKVYYENKIHCSRGGFIGNTVIDSLTIKKIADTKMDCSNFDDVNIVCVYCLPAS
jgi:hypothetical protein